MINDVEKIISCVNRPSECLLWRNVYLGLLGILSGFFIELFISFYILETKSVSVASFANVFFHSVSCPIVCCRFPMVFKTYSVD